MIQPLAFSSNIDFGNKAKSPMLQEMITKKKTTLSNETDKLDTNNVPTKDPKAKKTKKDKQKSDKPKSDMNLFQRIKYGISNGIKNVNTFNKVTAGATKGLFQGALATAVTGIIGKNIASSTSEEGIKVVTKTASGILTDTIKVLTKGLNYVGDFLKEDVSKVQHLKDGLKLPKNFYGYLKGHNVTKVAATTVGLGILAFNVIKSKMQANKENAETDHKFNTGHISQLNK